MGLQQLRNIRCVLEHNTMCVVSFSHIHITRSSTLIIFYCSETEQIQYSIDSTAVA